MKEDEGGLNVDTYMAATCFLLILNWHNQSSISYSIVHDADDARVDLGPN